MIKRTCDSTYIGLKTILILKIIQFVVICIESTVFIFTYLGQQINEIASIRILC